MERKNNIAEALDDKRMMLVINPISGTGSKTGVPDMVQSRFESYGIELDVRFTGGRGDATVFAREAAEKGYGSVIACGGDGTVNETARALCDTKTAMGIIPSGSGNGLARHLGIPIDMTLSIDIIETGNIVDSDYGTVNDHPFFCTFGMGFDAAVSHRFARQNRRGMLSYVKSAISEYVQFRPQVYTISANGKLLTEKAFLVAVCNASQWGNNAYIAPHASITDGLLDITVVHSGSPIDTAVMGMDIFSGFINKNTMVHCFRAPAAVIYRSEQGEAHIDGEPMIMDDILDIKCRHRALRLFTPLEHDRFRPIVTPIKDILRDARLTFNHFFNQ